MTLAEPDSARRSPRPGATVLLEREHQLERLRQSIAETVAGSGGVVVIEGPAGIGKTALLQATRGIAEDAGVRILRARGSELEQEFAFGTGHRPPHRGGADASSFAGHARAFPHAL